MADYLRRHKWLKAVVFVGILGIITTAAFAAIHVTRHGVSNRFLQTTFSATSCDTSYTVIGGTGSYLEITPPDIGDMLYVEVYNAGSATVDDFKVELQDHPDGEWYTFVSGTDFDTATYAMPFISSTTPDDVGSNGYSHFHMRPRGHAMRFSAKTASSTATVTVRTTFGAD